MHNADQAHQTLIQARERRLELQAKLFAFPSDPATARKTKGYLR